jgi:twitching motility protein PilT
MFPPHQHNQIRGQLAFILKGIISQRLIPTLTGKRVAAREVLIHTSAIATLIRDNKIEQIPAVIQTNSVLGMIPMERSLADLHAHGIISQDVFDFHRNDILKR